MRIPFTLSAIALVLLNPVAAQESSWLTDFEAAKAAAKKDNKVILADFTGSDWCGWCIKLKKEVFDTPEFRDWAAKKVVLLELDYPRQKEQSAEEKAQNAELAKRYGIRGYPTILFLDAEGKQLGQSGYEKGGPAAWIKSAESKMGNVAAATEDSSWMTNYEDAIKLAKKDKKVVMADFTGSDWCGWCIKLHEEVFSKPEFKEWAAEHVVLLELDFPRNKPQSDELKEQNTKLRDKFGIRGYPTILFLDGTGKQVGKSGYVPGGPEAWIAAVEKELGIKSKKPKAKKEGDKEKGK